MSLAAKEPSFDRPFEDIYRDLRDRIPRYCPQWTNYNDSDPGITLLHLFAWLAEMTLHKMSDVPRKNYMKFAQLLGLELAAPQPARVALVFTPKASERPQTIPERSRCSARGDSGIVTFETTQALDTIGALLVGMYVYSDGTIRNIELPALPDAAPFWPLGRNPVVGDALYLAFKPNPGNPRPFPQKMRFLALRPAAETNGAAQRVGTQDDLLLPPVELVWEYRTSSTQDAWERLDVFKDDSTALTRDGYIDVEGPQTIEPVVEPSLEAQLPAPYYWLRVRLDQNSYPQGRAPHLDLLLPNAVDAVNLSTESSANPPLGTSSGAAQQSFAFSRRPVDPDSLQITVTGSTGVAERWERVDDFYASKPEDKHYVLNSTAGSIGFGDGEMGLIPPAGALIAAPLWRYGGGAAANSVIAGAITTLVDQIAGIDKVINPRAAAGGSEEQDLDTFIARTPATLRAQKGAVTTSDFESLSVAIGGVKKAKTIGGRHPDYPDVEVPGAVTVFIVADTDRMPPLPSAELIRSVCTALDKRRLITTEVYVAAPTFLEVRIEVRLLVAPQAAFDQVKADARARLDDFLSPAKRDFGQDLSPAALYSTLLGPSDPNRTIHSVEDLIVYVDGQEQDLRRPMKVRTDTLIYPGNHLIVVRPDPDEWVAR